ncbi:MAG TPA: sugar nucleotide-binding protein [Pseudonocardiaceae bacterium]|nr:sugar nucleotide-binding protein [Pseudonocardiaceae bacterium]
MRTLIFGNGQIGNFYLSHYRAHQQDARVAVGVDITDVDAVRTAVTKYRPDVVINTAATTNLEWCGLNRLRAFEVNVLGAGNVARVCDEAGVYLVHYSSGCIFSSVDGTDAKVETDAPNPSSYYGWTKVWSEQIVAFERSAGFRCLVLRPRQPVSARVSPKNMLVKMLTFAKFVDTPNSGTVIEDLMEWTDELVARHVTGTYHVANTGYTTPYKIGKMIQEYILPDLEPEKIEKAELDRLTPNIRVDTVLDVHKLQALGIGVASYEDRLRDVVKQLGDRLRTMDKADLRRDLETTAAASRQRTVLNDVFPRLY